MQLLGGGCCYSRKGVLDVLVRKSGEIEARQVDGPVILHLNEPFKTGTDAHLSAISRLKGVVGNPCQLRSLERDFGKKNK
jgi:hypothetical protein